MFFSIFLQNLDKLSFCNRDEVESYQSRVGFTLDDHVEIDDAFAHKNKTHYFSSLNGNCEKKY